MGKNCFSKAMFLYKKVSLCNFKLSTLTDHLSPFAQGRVRNTALVSRRGFSVIWPHETSSFQVFISRARPYQTESVRVPDGSFNYLSIFLLISLFPLESSAILLFASLIINVFAFSFPPRASPLKTCNTP